MIMRKQALQSKESMGWRGILGFEYGIVQSPMGIDISGPELVAAVANVGALGFLSAPAWEDPDCIRELIRKTRTLTDKPFGVGVLLPFPHEENIKAILNEKVAVLQVSWGECSKELVQEAHSAGVKVVRQVGSVEGARKAIEAGVNAIVVQGREAGGHVIGQEGLISLLPRVVDLVGDRDIPVIGAGGIVDARGYVAALALGAQGVCLGTRFLTTIESNAHPTWKEKLVELDKTQYTDIYGRASWPNAPQRVLQTPFFNDWKDFPAEENELNQPVIAHSRMHGIENEVRRFGAPGPNVTTSGDIESMAMYAGEGVGLIKEIPTAGEVVKRLVEDAQLLLQTQLGGLYATVELAN